MKQKLELTEEQATIQAYRGWSTLAIAVLFIYLVVNIYLAIRLDQVKDRLKKSEETNQILMQQTARNSEDSNPR